MKEKLKELEILNKTIFKMHELKDCLMCCNSATYEERERFCAFMYDLEKRKTDLEIEINGCIIQEG